MKSTFLLPLARNTGRLSTFPLFNPAKPQPARFPGLWQVFHMDHHYADTPPELQGRAFETWPPPQSGNGGASENVCTKTIFWQAGEL